MDGLFSWLSFGLIAGSTAVTQNTSLERRASTQGSVDMSVSLAGAAGGLGSGFIMASSSYAMLGLVGGLLGLAILPLTLANRK